MFPPTSDDVKAWRLYADEAVPQRNRAAWLGPQASKQFKKVGAQMVDSISEANIIVVKEISSSNREKLSRELGQHSLLDVESVNAVLRQRNAGPKTISDLLKNTHSFAAIGAASATAASSTTMANPIDDSATKVHKAGPIFHKREADSPIPSLRVRTVGYKWDDEPELTDDGTDHGPTTLVSQKFVGSKPSSLIAATADLHSSQVI